MVAMNLLDLYGRISKARFVCVCVFDKTAERQGRSDSILSVLLCFPRGREKGKGFGSPALKVALCRRGKREESTTKGEGGRKRKEGNKQESKTAKETRAVTPKQKKEEREKAFKSKLPLVK